MRRSRKRWLIPLIGVGVLCIGVVVGLLVIYPRVGASKVREKVTEKLTAKLGRDVTIDDVLPSVRRHLATYFAWQPYDATPDYDARPEPGRGPRIELVRPGA